MSERMNKERAIEQLKFLRANIDESLQDLKEFKEFHEEKNECVSENHKQRIKECEEDIQALDIAIDSLQDEDLDISTDWLDEFIDWAKHRVEYTHKHYSDIINIRMTDNELIRIIKILENYKAKVEPYERKE